MRPTDRLRRAAERLAGTWHEFTVTEDGARLEGTLTSAFEADGCAFVQRFTSPDGGFTFISLAHVEDETERWRETYVFSDGRSASYEWDELADEIVVRRLGGNPADLAGSGSSTSMTTSTRLRRSGRRPTVRRGSSLSSRARIGSCSRRPQADLSRVPERRRSHEGVRRRALEARSGLRP